MIWTAVRVAAWSLAALVWTLALAGLSRRYGRASAMPVTAG